MEIKKSFLDINIDDIINWCKENNQLDWLLTESQKTYTVKRYTKRVKKLNADGTEALNKVGNPIWIADKSSKQKEEKQVITFVQLKYNFCEKFMPEKLPKTKKEKEPTMFDKIKAAANK